MSIRVLLADDHELFLEGLKELILKAPDIELAGQARDGLEALEQTALMEPDVVLMEDDPQQISQAMYIARKTIRIVKQNIVMAVGVKAACLLLGAFGMDRYWVKAGLDCHTFRYSDFNLGSDNNYIAPNYVLAPFLSFGVAF